MEVKHIKRQYVDHWSLYLLPEFYSFPVEGDDLRKEINESQQLLFETNGSEVNTLRQLQERNVHLHSIDKTSFSAVKLQNKEALCFSTKTFDLILLDGKPTLLHMYIYIYI